MMKVVHSKKVMTKNLYWLFAIIFFVFSMLQLKIVPKRIIESFEHGKGIVLRMFPPSLNEPLDVVGAALESLQVAVLSTILGMIISMVLAVFAARNLSPHISISYLVKAFAGFVRAVPALIWALLFIVAVGLGPTPGILALAVNSIGMLVKVYAEALEEIDMGVVDAMQATGASKLQVILQGILPTIMSSFISWSVFRFDVNIRYASVLGVVGAGGIGWELVRAARMLQYNEVLMITVVIFVMIYSAELLTRFLKNNAIEANYNIVKSIIASRNK